MDLNLHRLWIFVQVIERRGFSAAADELYMSQPSVSNQVRQLERSARVALVDRSGASVRATAEGEVLFEYAQRIFRLADEAVSALQEVSDVQSGNLVVGGTTTVGTYLLPPLVSAFQERYPNIECDIEVGNHSRVRGQLLDGEMGIAVVAGIPETPQLVSEPILTEGLVVITAPDHPLVGQRKIGPESVNGNRMLLREKGSQTRQLQEELLRRWGTPQLATSDVAGPETTKRCVMQRLGLSLISEHAVIDELRTGTLATLDMNLPLENRPINVVHRRDRLLSPAERAFVALLRNVRDWPSGASVAGIDLC